MILAKANLKRRGLSIVEASVVLSLCLLFVFSIYEYGRYVMARNLLDHAAREGARYAVVHTGDKTTADIQDLVDQQLAGQGKQLERYNKTTNILIYKADANGNNTGVWTDAQFGEYICVEITGSYVPVLPTFLMMQSSFTLKTKALMYSEAN